ncbi:MAG: 5-oxoprolinase subunit PxpA [Flavobacteriaceae bacterium]|nr:5-oxoprolinase subunit PxpA [Flavobacteriaceae bacterium]
MKNLKIDINADVGEGIGNEDQLFPLISSCNIACGGHAGNLETMLSVVRLAKKNNLKIGAHPSFPDRKNFGRKIMNISKDKLVKSLKNQIQALRTILIQENVDLNHIKPHGALYDFASNDKETARIIIDLTKEINTKLYAPYSSLISKMAREEGVKICNELFIDRNYNSNLTLVSRDNPNALIENSNEMFKHVYNIINNKIISVDKKEISVEFDTLCIHGDNPNAIELLEELHLKLNNIEIKII